MDMVICVCGSMTFANNMLEINQELEQKGIRCIIPEETSQYAADPSLKKRHATDAKTKGWFIRDHYKKINASHAILVVNPEKNGIANYIGANTFLEIGFAFVLEKKIFLLHGMPVGDNMATELDAMQPIACNGSVDYMIDYLIQSRKAFMSSDLMCGLINPQLYAYVSGVIFINMTDYQAKKHRRLIDEHVALCEKCQHTLAEEKRKNAQTRQLQHEAMIREKRSV